MLVDIDLDFGNKIVTGPGTRSLLNNWVFKRDTADELRVRFWSGTPSVQTELAADAAGMLSVKPLGKYDAEALVLAESWTKEGSGSSAVYVFEPDFDGAALAALLNSGDGNENNDDDYVECMAEILWIIDGKKRRTQTINTTVNNDVIKEGDGPPPVIGKQWGVPIHLTAQLPVSANTGDNGLMTFVPYGDETVADGDYIRITATDSTAGVEWGEEWIFRSVADPDNHREIQIQTNWNDTIYIWAQQLRAWSNQFDAYYSEDVYGRALLTLVNLRVADLWEIELNNYAGVVVDIEMPGAGDTTLEVTEAEAVGQLCNVSHSDGTFSQWLAARVSPVKWMPVSSGITWNAGTSKWQLLTFSAAGVLDLTDLPDQ